MAPGEIRLQAGAAAEVGGGQQQFALFPVTDAALHQRPVMVGVEPQTPCSARQSRRRSGRLRANEMASR